MRCGKRCQSAISIAVTAAALSVLVLWVTSYFFSFAMGASRARNRPYGNEHTFVGFHSNEGQLGVGWSWRRYTWLPLGTRPPGTQPAAASTDWEGDWEWRVDAGLPGSHSWFEWTGNALHETILGRLGFDVSNIQMSKPNLAEHKQAILVPWWAVFLVACVVATKWLFFRERRIYWGKVGRCVACGYDLRQSSGRCPECGLPVGADGGGAIGASTPAP